MIIYRKIENNFLILSQFLLNKNSKGEGCYSFTFLHRKYHLFLRQFALRFTDTVKLRLIDVIFPFFPKVVLLFLYTSHQEHNNRQDKQQRIGAPHGIPGTQYICSELYN